MIGKFSLKHFVIMIIISFFCTLSADSLLTPFNENIPLAYAAGDTIREYEVFGYPSQVRNRTYFNHEERKSYIDDHVFRKLLQIEGDIPSIRNSQEFESNYINLLSKNAVEYFREELIRERFISSETIENYSGNNHEGGLEEIIGEIKKAKQKEISNFIGFYLDSLKQKHGVFYDEEVFKQISEIDASEPADFSDKVKSIGLNKVLISYGNDKSYISNLAAKIREVKPYYIKYLSSVRLLKSLVEGPILNSILAEEAKKNGIFENELVLSKTKDQMKFFISKKYSEIISSDDKFIPGKQEMLDYYVSKREDRSLWSKRKMWVIEIFRYYDNSDEDESNHKIRVAIELENIRQKILSGEEEFEKYAKFYSRPAVKDGVLGFVFEEDYSMIGKTAYEMKSGEVSDLIIQDKAISIIKVDKIQESALYKFDYVEEMIKRRLIDEKKRQFFQDYKKELFEKYEVEYISSTSGVPK